MRLLRLLGKFETSWFIRNTGQKIGPVNDSPVHVKKG
jgi:hypothetical protein